MIHATIMPFVHPIRVITVYYFLCFFLLLAFRPGAGLSFAQTQANVDLAGKNILVIHSHEANAPVFWGTDKGLAETLESAGISGLNQFYESLNLRQNPGAEYRKLLVEQMRVRYGHRNLDMIITMYPEALDFVLNDCRDIFPHVPIIALYLPQTHQVPETDRRIIRHFTRLNILGTFEIALKLAPGTKRVYMIGGAHEVDQAVEAQARADLKKWESRLEFISLYHQPLEDMLATVSSVPPHSIILFLNYTIDITGKNYTNPHVLKRLRQVAAAPIFGLIDYNLTDVMVGGSLINFERIGSRAGQVVLKILGGTQVSENTQAILDVPPMPIFDWSQLRHWGFSENALPEGSIIKNKQFTIWDYRYYIIGIIAFCLAESALIIFLVVQKRRKKSAEESVRKAEEKYRNIFEGAVEGLFEVSMQGQPLTVNPALARILGYDSPGELISKIQDLGSQVYADPDKRAEYVELIEKQDVVLDFECEMLRRDGTKIWASISSRRVCGPDGKTLYYRGFLEDITERKQAFEASRKNDEILQQSEKDLRLLAGRLIHNQEEERSRLARELHDDLVQRLAVFAIDIGRLELELKDQPTSVQEKLNEMKNDMVKISGDVHNLSRRLHPSILDDLGLIRAIESQCTNFAKREGAEVVFSHENIHSVIPKDISLSLYRIIQEGLSNISKHACADHISISLKGTGHDILLAIEDNGIGFDSAAVKAKPGLGLSSIRERVRLFQGEHSINSQPGKGTRITVRVPLQGLMKEGE